MNWIRILKTKHSNELTLGGTFVLVFLLLTIISPEKFLTPYNLGSMAFQMPEFGLLSLGMMGAILTGGMNLSLCCSAALSSILAAFVLSSPFAAQNPGMGIFLAIVTSVASAIVMGAINGGIIAYIGVAAMLVTLGTMTLFQGIATNITKGGAVSGFPDVFRVIGGGNWYRIPLPFLIYILAIVAAHFLLEKSAWGMKVYMTGCNETATRFSGINTRKALLQVYLFSSIMSCIAGIIMISRYNSAKVDYGSSYLMMSISAVVLGGTSINGGRGTVAGTVIAVGIIQIVTNGLNIIGINRYLIDVMIGLILILVLSIRFYSGKISDRKRTKAKLAA